MAIKYHNPKSVSLGKYSLGAEVPPGARAVRLGQVGVDARGKLQAGIEKQCAQAWKNVGQVLKSAGMGFRDVVKVNVFLTDSRFIGALPRVARQRSSRRRRIRLDAPDRPGLADPSMLVEIEAVAAK